MSKISAVGLACAVAFLVFWKTTLNHPPLAPSVSSGAVVPGEMVIPSNLPEANAVDS